MTMGCEGGDESKVFSETDLLQVQSSSPAWRRSCLV
jgi:hypothetical protein